MEGALLSNRPDLRARDFLTRGTSAQQSIRRQDSHHGEVTLLGRSSHRVVETGSAVGRQPLHDGEVTLLGRTARRRRRSPAPKGQTRRLGG